MADDNKLTFIAEVVEVKSKKTASLDVTYRIVLQTEDANVLGLGALTGDTLLKVDIVHA